MEDTHRFLVPLAEMDVDLTLDGVWVIEREIAARLRAGRGHEVMDYMAHCDIALRKALGATVLDAIDAAACDDFLMAADQLITSDPALFATLLREQGALFGPSLASLIWEKQYPALLPLLFPLMTQSRRAISAYEGILHAILSRQPTLLLTAEPGKLDLLIPLLPTDLLRAILPELGAMIAKTSSKAVRDAVVAASAHLDLDEMCAAGWFTVRNKNLRLACRDLLLAHPNQAAAAPLLAGMLAAGELDPASASALAAVLAPIDAGAAPSLAQLEAQAAGITRWSAAIKPLDHAEVLALFQPLSGHAARAALHLAATGDEALPPLAAALLAQLSADRRARLALHAVQTWIAGEGEPKLRSMLRLLANGADERIAEPLGAAVFAWGKKSKYPRAVVALAQLSALDTPYALLRVMEAAESIKLKGPVIHAAVKALDAAAQRRNCAMGELIDDLTPDFGLAEDFSLIDADDKPFPLAPEARIALWHPAGAAAGEAEAWRSHLADYLLTPLIDQTGAPAALPPAAQLTGDCLLAPPGLSMTQPDLAAILGKAGYSEGQRSGTHAAWIDWHAWPLPTARLEVRILHSAGPASPHFGMPVGIAAAELRDAADGYALVPSAHWPKSLLATVWSHLLLLDAKRPA
ncbi:DUF4132 domain-containing protein [Massilia sp. CCM 8733]|uniref:DUF4132 domain-containing protein n=1 Tax=Massilia mucilaginosa TaxID=2609282 RepID=A0ABX0NWI4_9BURK|nr:DUF4132 domain-containing protein [Massilia mucilaginosa]NHZ91020.1 DUF4132 domain-containing protein [Massilia mucilaginosa]